MSTTVETTAMDYLEMNQAYWNVLTDVHTKSDFYQVDEFLAGKNMLKEIELPLLGDLQGKSVLHLQCHFGMDTMSLSRLGAQATGVDLSDQSIDKAQDLSSQLGLNTRFIQSDVYSLPEKLDEKFDIVFTSYGALNWLPDMDKWAKVVKHFMKPGGDFVMAEFHPVVWMLDEDFQKIKYPYSSPEAIIDDTDEAYTGDSLQESASGVLWNHGLADILGALIKNGLHLTHFEEFNYSLVNCFANTVETEPGKWQLKGMVDKVPMLYSLKANLKS